MKLGEILVKQGLVNEAQLALALAQKQAQGRLGSYLVEQGVVTTDQVALALAAQYGVAPALEADFLRADAALRKRLVVHQAVELQAIPLFFINARRVAIAMANPTHARALDRLAFIFGATVEPLAASDAAITQQLELLYRVGGRSASRAARKLLDQEREKRARDRAPAEEPEIRPALRTHRQRLRAPRLAPLEPGTHSPEPCAPVTMLEEAVCFTPTPLSALPQLTLRTPPTPTRVTSRNPLTPIVVPITSAGVQLAVEQIRYASDEQDLADNLFTFMRTGFGAGAMFDVAGTLAQGRFGFCDGRVCPEVENLRCTLSLPSCLRIARSRRRTFRGPPPPDGRAIHLPLWAALQTPPPVEVLVAPVVVDGQITLLLYAQGEPGSRINDLTALHMEQVCEALGSSLLRLAG
jgi:hypothetical protein